MRPAYLVFESRFTLGLPGNYIGRPNHPGSHRISTTSSSRVASTGQRKNWPCSNGRHHFFLHAIVAAPFYEATLNPALSETRVLLGINIWPYEWPILFQVFLAFFLSEFIWYWFHRAEHRWLIIWRVSGHGAHHSFKNLGAINYGANHPLEYFVLLVPSAIVELLFGAGAAIGGAAILLVTQASIVHSNIPLNSGVIGWLLTTNRYHIHHHSMVIEESNTNYGCAVILWDRLFGTFSNQLTEETGIGPSEPSLFNKFIMPIREPTDSQISP